MRPVSDLLAIYIWLLMMVRTMEVTGTVWFFLHISTKDMVFHLINSDLGFFYIWP